MKAWRHTIIAKVVSLLILIAAAGSLAKAEAAAWQGDWLYIDIEVFLNDD